MSTLAVELNPQAYNIKCTDDTLMVELVDGRTISVPLIWFPRLTQASQKQFIPSIQVTYDMTNDKTRKREIKGLVNACKTFGLDQGLIITYDEESEMITNGIKIKVMPLYLFLLG